jgi:hypothetical protein
VRKKRSGRRRTKDFKAISSDERIGAFRLYASSLPYWQRLRTPLRSKSIFLGC